MVSVFSRGDDGSGGWRKHADRCLTDLDGTVIPGTLVCCAGKQDSCCAPDAVGVSCMKLRGGGGQVRGVQTGQLSVPHVHLVLGSEAVLCFSGSRRVRDSGKSDRLTAALLARAAGFG